MDPTCITGCPVEINIPKFIKNIERNEFLEAATTLKESNALPACVDGCAPGKAVRESMFLHAKTQ